MKVKNKKKSVMKKSFSPQKHRTKRLQNKVISIRNIYIYTYIYQYSNPVRRP